MKIYTVKDIEVNKMTGMFLALNLDLDTESFLKGLFEGDKYVGDEATIFSRTISFYKGEDIFKSISNGYEEPILLGPLDIKLEESVVTELITMCNMKEIIC